MVITIICGALEDTRFPGRNTFPLIGRAMVTYPILAAKYAGMVDDVYVTTDAPAISRIANHLDVEVIDRPKAISGAKVPLTDIVSHGFQYVISRLKTEIEAVVVLLANAPTITAEMIDQGIDMLMNDGSLDAVISVGLHNEYHPHDAYSINAENLLVPHPASVLNSVAEERTDSYFNAAVLWVLRPDYFTDQKIQAIKPKAIINPSTQRVRPLIFEGYGDIDYRWQVPGVVEWLRRHGFSEESTPYDAEEAQRTSTLLFSPTAVHESTCHNIERRVLITTVPFGEVDRTPLDLLEAEGIPYVINPLNRKLKESELMELTKDFTVVIAGTELHSKKVMENAPHLRFISRVGIGLDSVDLRAARERKILVSYTPDAPAPAVAELTIGLMVSLLRAIPQTDRNMRQGIWHRIFGRRLAECTVGIIGVGRVGTRVIRHLNGFVPKQILANDNVPDTDFGDQFKVEWTDKETIFRQADVISLHVPLTSLTRNLITYREIGLMKPTTVLINTSRGGIVSEVDLAFALRSRQISGVAIDTYLHEPYSGELTTLENCILTSHMGSMSVDCRCQMELEATQEVVRFLKGEPLVSLVPDSEYDLQCFI